MLYRRDQLRGKNEVGYQHECWADQSAGPEGAHEGQPDTNVDPDTSSIPSRLVLLLSYLSASRPIVPYPKVSYVKYFFVGCNENDAVTRQ